MWTITMSAWLKLEKIRYRNMDEVTVMELQELVNGVAREYSKCTTGRVITLIKGLYKYAIPRELCRKETGIYVDASASYFFLRLAHMWYHILQRESS